MTIEVMVIAFRRSRDALYALFFFLITCVVLFSTLLYFAERGVWDEKLQTFVDPNGKPRFFIIIFFFLCSREHTLTCMSFLVHSTVFQQLSFSWW